MEQCFDMSKLFNKYLVFNFCLFFSYSLFSASIQFAKAETNLNTEPEPSKPGFAEVLKPPTLSWPRSHGAHPLYATEWWYFTGHLTSSDKPEHRAAPEIATEGSYGFELVFFRVGINPEANSSSRSAWKMQSLYLAHAALTDDSSKSFSYAERRSRGAFAEAGASEEGLNVWLRDWSAKGDVGEKNGSIELNFEVDAKKLRLLLTPEKAVVLHGEKGLSRKGPNAGEASYYTSFSRLKGEGDLFEQGVSKKLFASAWFDHEVTSSELSRGTIGWDWFSLQLKDGRELMLYQLRTAEGGISPFSSGTLVEKDGSSEHLKASDFSIAVQSSWTSPKSGITYPALWRIRLPEKDIDFKISPTVPAQELFTPGSTGLSYWEGRARVEQSDKQELLGSAYIELVGYDKKAGGKAGVGLSK